MVNATFENYQTDLCPYMERLNDADAAGGAWPAVSGEVIEEVALGPRLSCKKDSTTQQISLVVPADADSIDDADSFFANLTAKLRREE